MSSLVSFALGLEKDWKMSDCSRFGAAGLLVGFFSVGLLSACGVDPIDWPLDEGRSGCLEVSTFALTP